MVRLTKMTIYELAMPMRSFEHAAASRTASRSILVRLDFSDGTIGWGETLPRDYVTGETFESAEADLKAIFFPALCEQDLADADAVTLPLTSSDGRCINAAACAVDLALRWAKPTPKQARRIETRITGVLGSADPKKTAKRLWLMHLFGLRDFKLKLGFGEAADTENLRICHRKLARGMRASRSSLRVDVNGGWPLSDTPEHVEALVPFGVCVVEQPTFTDPETLLALARRCVLPLMADESLLTRHDAAVFLACPEKLWWNVRISKNGGLGEARALLQLAADHGVTVSNGCMVGESGILSAAQRRLLATSAAPRFAEGNYGRLLLSDDITTPSPRFGYGGKLRVLKGEGFGVGVNDEKVEQHATKIWEQDAR